MIALSVNLNKIALLRNSREGNYPSVIEFAKRCLRLGVAGLTAHPRPDQRHIRPDDIRELSELIQEHNAANNASVEFNIEGNPFADAKGEYPGLLALVDEVKPDQCTLVPDSDTQLTSDHGFDLVRDGETVAPMLQLLREKGVRSSLFMDPVVAQITLAKKYGADRIELYTGPFAWAYGKDKENAELVYAQHQRAAVHAQSLGLGINAGHDLNLNNMQLYRNLPGLLEVSIGHALTIDALEFGWDTAVEKYLTLCQD